MQKLDTGRFNLKKLNEGEGKEWYQVKIWKRFTTFKNLDHDMDINKAWETTRIGENSNISAEHIRCFYELK
jgi:hypothetical protein